jgi:uncharacterized OB-fold protein
MSTADKQIPKPTELDLEFFQAAASTGELHVQKCADCSDHHHPPRMYCPRCYSGRYAFEGVSGRGTVYSHTVSHYTTEKAWKGAVPWVTVVVELDEGPRLVGTARGIDPGDVRIGLPVRVVTETVTEDFAYLWVEADTERTEEA